MKQLRIDFNETCHMDCYIHESYEWDINGRVNKEHPAIIVFPGGGYLSISCSEAEPVALTFLEEGFSTFVLNYSCDDKCLWPQALHEILWSIWQVRSHAKEWEINPDAISVMGFSAGGGMAAIAATQWNTEGVVKILEAPDLESLKPNAAILGYGDFDATKLISTGFLTPDAYGKAPSEGDIHFDPVKFIGKHTPPVFIWHGRRDDAVPSYITMDFVSKLEEFDISYELHMFDFAGHGMTVFNRTTDSDNYDMRKFRNVSKWTKMAANWLMNTFKY